MEAWNRSCRSLAKMWCDLESSKGVMDISEDVTENR
jgi:hypothetical protein